jgi:hypothetical protein
MKRKATDEISKENNQPAPDYGSKEYWEARYKNNLDTCDSGTADNSRESLKVVEGVQLSTEIQAGHAWYFSYEELRPLILGLILDKDDDKPVEMNDYVMDEEDDWEEDHDDDDNEINGEASEQDDGDEQEYESEADACENESNDNTDESIDLLEASLKQSTPQLRCKSILEIGCGDVPLGSSLTTELNSLQLSTGCNARNIVSSVECTDYSEVVIESLNKQQQELQKVDQEQKQQVEKYTPIYPKYTTNDARHLPHNANSISLILEKGTLDAMLSHPSEGISNSMSIVKEMARVVQVGGAILIVSHLNAREEKGMEWVNDVMMAGLRQEWVERKKRRECQQENENNDNNVEILWSIEVHGGETNEEDNTSEEHEPDYGPAVYILKKRGVERSIFNDIMQIKKQKNGNEDEDEMPPVKLEFLTYS